MADPVAVTAADIARLAGVTRGTVSNWRRRHADFPDPIGGTDASPYYDRTTVESWLEARGALVDSPPQERLWRAVAETAVDDEDLRRVVHSVAVSLTLLAAMDPSYTLTADIGETAEATAIAGERGNRLHTAVIKAVDEIGAFVAMRAILDRYAEQAGISVTPKEIADLMNDLAGVSGGTVIDPACGTGELLVAALDHGASNVRGQELDEGLSALAGAFTALLSHPGHVTNTGDSRDGWIPDDAPTASVITGDSLLTDGFSGVEADAVVCHPPFGSRDWGHDQLAGDARWVYGIPPRAEPELAWAQHALAHVHPGARAVILMPPAAASRPSGRRIRAELLRSAALRAVVALPAGALQPMHVPVHLWVLERPARTAPADPRVLLVDVSDRETVNQDGGRDAARTRDKGGRLSAAVSAAVLDAWQLFTANTGQAPASQQVSDSQPGTWQVMRAIDLLDQAVDLTPARHVARADPSLPPTLRSERLGEIRDELQTALVEFECLLRGEDWEALELSPQWRTAAVTDLVRAGMMEYLRERRDEPVLIQCGDVLIPPVLVEGARLGAGLGELRTRVAGADEAGTRLGQQVSLLRPDPAQVDPWFVAGFITAPNSIRQASYGTSAVRIDARRLELPLLPVDQQRNYGAAFRHLHEAERAAASVAGLTGELTALIAGGLKDGSLLPRSPLVDGSDDGEAVTSSEGAAAMES